MSDLVCLWFMMPPFIIIAVGMILSELSKKGYRDIKRKEREERISRRNISRNKDYDEELKFRFSEKKDSVINKGNDKMNEIYEYIKNNVEGV